MEEEKKNNKGLMVGIIIFLIICLVAIFYFMFKMTYVGSSKSENANSKNIQQNEEETASTTLTNISCYYKINSKTYNEECKKYNAENLNEQYNLPKDHIITKIITSDDKVEYLVLTNGYEKGKEE